jgi:uncharacterized alkaline shock family protein YloU
VSVLLRERAGSVTVATGALSSLVVQAAESVEGVRVRRARRHLAVTLDDGSAHVEVELAVKFGVVLPDAARAVQERVADALRAMCAVEIETVDVTVEEVE